MAAQVAKPTKTTRNTPRRKQGQRMTKEEKQEIVDLKKDNPLLTQEQIGSITNTDRSTVSRVLAKYQIEEQDVTEFKSNRADVFTGLQEKIVSTLTTDDIKKASIKDRFTALGIAYDKERLETGKSTQNVAVIQFKMPDPAQVEDATVLPEKAETC